MKFPSGDSFVPLLANLHGETLLPLRRDERREKHDPVAGCA